MIKKITSLCSSNLKVRWKLFKSIQQSKSLESTQEMFQLNIKCQEFIKIDAKICSDHCRWKKRTIMMNEYWGIFPQIFQLFPRHAAEQRANIFLQKPWNNNLSKYILIISRKLLSDTGTATTQHTQMKSVLPGSFRQFPWITRPSVNKERSPILCTC